MGKEQSAQFDAGGGLNKFESPFEISFLRRLANVDGRRFHPTRNQLIIKKLVYR
jgi:hypothetical protein